MLFMPNIAIFRYGGGFSHHRMLKCWATKRAVAQSDYFSANPDRLIVEHNI
jgi:hypothetical protein